MRTFVRQDPQYWDITLDSYEQDAKSITEYVLRTTGTDTVGVVCHSIGCTSVYQMLAEYNQFNELIKPLFAIGPYVFAQNSPSFVLSIPAVVEPYLR